MMDEIEEYDEMLLTITQLHKGGITELLSTFFGFLHRKTDFFHGAAAGIPRKTVLGAMQRYEKLAELRRKEMTNDELPERIKNKLDEDYSKINNLKKDASSNIEEMFEEKNTIIIGESKNTLEKNTKCSESKVTVIHGSTSSIAVRYEVLETDLTCSTLPIKKRRKQKIPSKNITPIPSKRKVGRPKLEFDTYRAKHLISLGFTMAQVCNALGISDGTLRRFRDVNKDCKLYNKIPDQELDAIITEVKKEHVHIGEKRLLGLLKGRGLRIQRKRLRESIHRVDPSGPKERCNAGIALVNARTSMVEYESRPKINRVKKLEAGIQVPSNITGPNSVWRIDTITKLERWKINICLGIDIFSRVIAFIVASGCGTNLAESNCSTFKKAIKKYSWPTSILTDKREEKTLIWKHMQETKGDISAEITDKLERVQWITIIKNDLNLNIFRTLSETFYSFECEGSLDVSNDADIFCLHFVYLPRMNKLLDDFVTSYNACAIPHGSGATPLQIFYAHSDNASGNNDILPNLSSSREVTTIEITLQGTCPIPEDKLEDLYDYVRPLEESSDNGKELYYRTGTYVTQYLRSLMEEEKSSTSESDEPVKTEDGKEFDTEEDMFTTDQFDPGHKNVNINPNVIMNKSAVVMNCPLTSIVSNTLSLDDQPSVARNNDVQIVSNVTLVVDDGNIGIYEYYDDDT